MQNFRVKRLRSEDGLSYMQKYLGRLKKVGQIYQARCPFHNERTGSFTLFPPGYVSKNGKQDYTTFYCFGCNQGGDIIKFKSLLDNISREEAIIALEKEFNLSDDEQGELDFLTTELAIQQNQIVQGFTFEDISLLFASYCRQYLTYIKQNYYNFYNHEMKVIDYYYRFFDYIFEQLNINQASNLLQKIKQRLKYRRQMVSSLIKK